MPPGSIHENDSVSAFGDVAADLVEVHLHGLGVGLRQDEGGTDAAARADGAKEIGILVALIGRQARTGAGLGPDARSAILLPDPGFVLKPDLNRLGLGQMAYVGCERAREVFLNPSSTC